MDRVKEEFVVPSMVTDPYLVGIARDADSALAETQPGATPRSQLDHNKFGKL